MKRTETGKGKGRGKDFFAYTYTSTYCGLFTSLPLCLFLLISAYGKEVDSGAISGRVIAKNLRYQKDTVVYIDRVEGVFLPPKEHAIMDQKYITFVPHILPILVGTTVDFHNSDTIPHNVYSKDEVADKMNLGTWRQGEVRSYTFNKPGSAVILCHIHAEMEAYIVVLQNPYFAVTKKNGKFVIDNIPEGLYYLKVWHKFLKAEDVKLEVKKGETVEVNFNLK